jgi:hypothetical protein
MGCFEKSFEKAYDKVNWEFLFDCCKQKWFSDNWLDWIRKVVSKGSLSVKVNDMIGLYFARCKGVRQEDPFAPFLFNMATNSLAKMICLAQHNGIITWLASKLTDKGVAMLQCWWHYFADSRWYRTSKESKTLAIYIFESMYGLKINFEKSKSMLIMEDDLKVECFG